MAWLERKFTENVLENDSSIEACIKLNQYVHQFSIPYINNMGNMVPYYPDLAVKTRDGMYIIETKSTEFDEKDAPFVALSSMVAMPILTDKGIVENA